MTPQPLRCAQCGTTAPAHFVVCPKCHALFHAAQLQALKAEADALEQHGDALGALGKLREMQPLLPAGAAQAKAVTARIAALEPVAAKQPGAPSKAPKWLAAFGAVGLALWKFAGPLVALLSKGKLLFTGLLKLPTLLSFFISASLWRDGPGGWALALVVLSSIYVHEVGHMVAFRRYGIAVTPPMFIPGVGAFVRGSHYPTSASAAGDVALSGPLWGGVFGLVTLLAAVGLEAKWLVGAALLVAEINLFNLLPVWQLDGGRAFACLSPRQALGLGLGGLALAALAGTPMGLLACAGLVGRRFVYAPTATGEGTTFRFFGLLLVGLLALRFVAQAWLGRYE